MIERSIGYQKGEGRVKRNKQVRTVEPVALITYNIGVVSYSFVQKKSSISILRNDVYYDSIRARIHYLSLSYTIWLIAQTHLFQ